MEQRIVNVIATATAQALSPTEAVVLCSTVSNGQAIGWCNTSKMQPQNDRYQSPRIQLTDGVWVPICVGSAPAPHSSLQQPLHSSLQYSLHSSLQHLTPPTPLPRACLPHCFSRPTSMGPAFSTTTLPSLQHLTPPTPLPRACLPHCFSRPTSMGPAFSTTTLP